MIADVHTSGVNIESVSTIVGSVTAVLATVGAWINNKIEKHRKATSQQIDTVATALAGRLDRFDEHLGEQDRNMQGVSVRVARLEGNVSAINRAVNGGAVGDPSIRQNVETLIGRGGDEP